MALFSMVTLRLGAWAVEAPEAQALDAGAAPSGSQAEGVVSLRSTVASCDARFDLLRWRRSWPRAALLLALLRARALKQETATKDFPSMLVVGRTLDRYV